MRTILHFFLSSCLLLIVGKSYAKEKTDDLLACPTATISYNNGGHFCQGGIQQPVIISGTESYLGGIYNAIPFGLSISINGTITVNSSNPGTYTVLYTIPSESGCPTYTATTTVSISAIPVINATVSENPICSGETVNIFLVSQVPGTTYTWTINSNNVLGATSEFSGVPTFNPQVLTLTPGPTSGQVVYLITPSANGCYGSPIQVQITVNSCPLNENDFTVDNFKLYPNPVIDKLSIQNNTKISSITILNKLGQIIYSQKTDLIDLELDFNTFDSGIYFLIIESGNKKSTHKIVKQ